MITRSSIDLLGGAVGGWHAQRTDEPEGDVNLPLVVCLHGGGCTSKYFDLDGVSFVERAADQGFEVLELGPPGPRCVGPSAARPRVVDAQRAGADRGDLGGSGHVTGNRRGPGRQLDRRRDRRLHRGGEPAVVAGSRCCERGNPPPHDAAPPRQTAAVGDVFVRASGIRAEAVLLRAEGKLTTHGSPSSARTSTRRRPSSMNWIRSRFGGRRTTPNSPPRCASLSTPRSANGMRYGIPTRWTQMISGGCSPPRRR